MSGLDCLDRIPAPVGRRPSRATGGWAPGVAPRRCGEHRRHEGAERVMLPHPKHLRGYLLLVTSSVLAPIQYYRPCLAVYLVFICVYPKHLAAWLFS